MDLDAAALAKLLPRYDTSGPRYTSYPTAPVWTDVYGPADFADDLATRGDGPLSVYVHVPFCRRLCHFCACNRVVTRDPALPESYLATLERETELVRSRLPGAAKASQVHWGGGTPTHLTPDQIRRLHQAVAGAFEIETGAELSIEVDPRVTTAEHVAALRDCGFRRMSLGVQDFDPRVQEAVHRVQSVDRVETLVRCAREAGFGSVGFDLIYGLPFQTLESFGRTLDAVVDLAPDRIALYGYAHVTWVAKQQRGFERKALPDPAARLAIFLSALRRLLEAGYVYVGMDHFARPEDDLVRALREGTLRRNFMGYTTQAGVELLGLGPSAISELRASYAQSERTLDAWETAIGSGRLATMRGHRLSEDDRARRWVIQEIMCRGEVDALEFRSRFAGEFAERFAPELARLAPALADGLIERTAGGLRLAPTGRVLVRNVAMAFDAHLAHGDRPTFSRTV